ncbi:hypothetical protein A4X13_0g2979 [Tilletia indica]|uniref:F-box domain-containing protein n=1 Tax=Tilletia indica TaxID=43049 RepID=A0A177TBZ5_9BASI|nr:hypothetical protein A4X13_0g2979 [Tilletia indica]
MSTSASMSSASGSLSSSSSPVSSLLSLPPAATKSLLLQCDYHTLKTLRQTCKSIKETIDADPSLDEALFRYKPLSNPCLTQADQIQIRRLAHDRTLRAFMTHPYAPKPARYLDDLSKPVNAYIDTHPAINQLYWSSENFWAEAMLSSEVSIEDVPHIQNECATRPSVSLLEVVLTSQRCPDRYLDLLVKFGGAEERMGAPPPQPSPPGNAGLPPPPQPVRVKDVISALVGLSHDWDDLFPSEDPDQEDSDDETLFRVNTPPKLEVKEGGLLVLTFDDCFDF